MSTTAIAKTFMSTRTYFVQHVDDLTEKQLIEVPNGASNNILWNIGHIVNSHDRMLYSPCGIEVPSPPLYDEWFKAGSSPSTWKTLPNADEVLDEIENQGERILKDYTAGKFDNYESWELVPGLSLDNADEAMGFCAMHEGIHLGSILALRQQLGVKV